MLPPILRLVDNVRQKPLVKNVAVLATGAALAQGITVLASPVLTRLYSPEAFGLFATFIALVSSLTPAATGKYEVALMLPSADKAARELYAVALWFCALLCGSLLLAIWTLHTPIIIWLNVSDLRGWILLAPFTLLLIGIFNLTGYAANRRNQYEFIARSTVTQAAAIAGINIALGLAGAQFFGLIIGNISGLIASLAYLSFTQRDFIREVTFQWSARKYALARRYRDFPIYNASTGILDGVTANLPIFFLIAYFSPEIAGFYALVIRVINAPITIFSAAVSRVNLKKVVDLVNAGERVVRYLIKASTGLLIISLPPTIVFIVWGPQIFSFVFGDEWLQAGEIAQVLAFAIAVKFVSSTLSSTLGATNNNRYTASWRIVAFFSTFIVLGLMAYKGSLQNFILALALNEIVIYLFYFYLIILAARNPRN